MQQQDVEAPQEGGAGANVPAPRPVQGIRCPQALNLDCNVNEHWKLFKQKWSNYRIIAQLDRQPAAYQVALLLHTIGDEALKVYNGFQFNTPEADRTTAEILEKFDTFAIGEINETYERFMFNKRDQTEGETFDQFLSAIRTLIRSCNYCDNCVNSILRDRIVIGIQDTETQTALLKERNLTLDGAIDLCKAAEKACAHRKALRPEEKLNKLKHRSGRRDSPKSGRASSYPKMLKECKFCGKSHARRKEECPAWGKSCAICKGKNHFAVKCAKRKHDTRRKVHQVVDSDSDSGDAGSDSEPEWLNSVQESDKCLSVSDSKVIKCKLLVDEKPVVFQVDSGATVNVIPSKMVSQEVVPTSKSLIQYGGSKISPKGVTRLVIRNPRNKKRYSIEFVVVKENYSPIIGLRTAEQMKLISVNNENFDRVNALSVVEKHPEVFDGELGEFPGEVHLRVDPTVKPVILPARRVPVALRPKLKVELEKLRKMKVLVSVDEPTPWVNQIAIVQKKSGDIRICIDPRELNRALKREHFTMPILEESLHELSKSRYFSKADLANGYWHCKLDKESSMLTTFQTPFGRFRFLRLPFGLNVSAEIFQKKLLENLEGLNGVICIADDCQIHGVDEANHDDNFDKFLTRCKEMGIKLNKNDNKLVVKQPQTTFMGHITTKDGLRIDPEKIRAIQDLPTPTNKDELRRFLGMVNFLAKYVPNHSEEAHPLQQLLKDEVTWNWSSEQEKAFDKLKSLLVSAPCLAYYDPEKELVLQNDASDYGIGSVLLQEGRPIAYASRKLKSAERDGYAPIEKEMAAVLFGLTKFHHQTYGREVTVITDHQPLVSIKAKALAKAPRRLRNFILQTQDYNYKLVYKPGKELVLPDTLSRAPVDDKNVPAPATVNNLAFTPINSERLEEIRKATAEDGTLVQLSETIMSGWPKSKANLPAGVTTYFSYRDELTVQDGIILRGERIVIPTSMRGEMKRKVHAGHSGINSCLRRAREYIYWPGMSSDIRQFVEACNTCASMPDRLPQQPLNQHEVPDRPWQKVGTDIFYIEGRAYLVTVDYFSRYFEIDYLQDDTKASVVISKMKQHFARHGIPDSVISDNGPQYSSSEFRRFAKNWNFEHERIAPGNSKANGAAEAAVKIAKRLMKRSIRNGEDPYLGLLNLRNTPHEGLNSSPVQRLMNRRTKTQMPTTRNLLRTRHDQIDQDRLLLESTRSRVAQRHIDKPILKPLSVGTPVRMQPIEGKKGKEWNQATITKQVSGRAYEVATPSGKTFRRDRQFLRVDQSKVLTPDPGITTPSKLPRPTPSKPPHPPEQTMPAPFKSPSKLSMAHLSPGKKAAKPCTVTKSGRRIHAPKKLNL